MAVEQWRFAAYGNNARPVLWSAGARHFFERCPGMSVFRNYAAMMALWPRHLPMAMAEELVQIRLFIVGLFFITIADDRVRTPT